MIQHNFINQPFEYFQPRRTRILKTPQFKAFPHQSMPSLFTTLNIQKNIANQQQSLQRVKNKLNRYNNELLQPCYLLENFRNKIQLSPLIKEVKKPQEVFKLKSYHMQTPNQYQYSKQQEDESEQNQKESHQSISQLNNTRFSLLRQMNSQNNKQNLHFQNQLAQMLVTQSKLKYFPKDTLGNKQNKQSKFINTYLNDQERNIRKSIHSQSHSVLNQSSSHMSIRTFSSIKSTNILQKYPQLLNNTRTKIIRQINKIPLQKLTKNDLFPLQKLLKSKSKNLNFRNKWFNQKKTQSYGTQ